MDGVSVVISKYICRGSLVSGTLNYLIVPLSFIFNGNNGSVIYILPINVNVAVLQPPLCTR